MKTQAETINIVWLYSKGYTISSAARKIGRSAAHVNMVINGKRESAAVANALRALPSRPLVMREPLAAK